MAAEYVDKVDIFYEHKYLNPISPSKKEFKRDFVIEKKRSFDIVGIAFHSYRNSLLDIYDGITLDLEYEPWNEYDPNAIAIRMAGSKLGYIRRYDTEEVSNIMTFSKHYWATFDYSCKFNERVNISFLQEIHDTCYLPFQTDVVLKATCSASKYEEYLELIKSNVGHSVKFCESYENNLIAILTDMQCIIGYIDDMFISKQSRKTHIAGYVEDVVSDDDSKQIEVRLRLLMEKSVINKNYLKSYQALGRFFRPFYDAGTYCISYADMLKVVPRKKRSLSAYEPLVNYLKDYHAIQLIIEKPFQEVSKNKRDIKQIPDLPDHGVIEQSDFSMEKANTIFSTNPKTTPYPDQTYFSIINEFFPVNGVTLGKTTWKEVEKMGSIVEILEKGPGRRANVEGVPFGDNDGTGVFTTAFWSRFGNDFPLSWRLKRFSFDLSYDEWMEVFKTLGFSITVTKQPCQKEFLGQDTLSARFEALSSDGLLLFEMHFDYGKDGYYTSSPKTLFCVFVTYKGGVTRNDIIVSEDGKTLMGVKNEVKGHLVIPEGVEVIAQEVFKNNIDITGVLFPESLREIKYGAFYGCTGIRDVTLNDGLKTIANDAFRGAGFSKVIIPYNVENIGTSAFTCDINVDKLNSHFMDIDGILFSYDKRELVIYPSAKHENEYIVPECVEKIRSLAFENSSLHSISLPRAIWKLDNYVFYGCKELKALTCHVKNPEIMNISENAFVGFKKEKCKLIVPRGCKEKYLSHRNFRWFMSIEEATEECAE